MYLVSKWVMLWKVSSKPKITMDETKNMEETIFVQGYWSAPFYLCYFIFCFCLFLSDNSGVLQTSDVVETVTDETETWLKPRDRDFIKNFETET